MHVDSTPDTPTHIHTHAATGPIHSVPVEVEPIHSTGLDSTASKTGYRAKEADLHATSGVPASKVDVHPTTKLNQGYNSHHPTTATDAHPSTGSIDAHPTTTSATTTDSRPLTEKVKAPVVGAASAMGAAATDTAAYLGNKASEAKESVKETVNNLTTSATSDTPSSTTSSYATMDSTKGTYNPSVSSSTSYTPPASANAPTQSQSTYTTPPVQPAHTTAPYHHTTTSDDSRPLTDKVKAPAVGAASAMGAVAAAYLGNKASPSTHQTTPNVFNNNINNNTYSSSTPMNTPMAKTATSTTASDSTPAAAFAEPMIQTTTSAINPVTEPAIVRSPTLDTYQTKTTTTNPSSSLDSHNAVTSSSRPMTEKFSAPAVGAASALGGTAAGTAAYPGNKATDSKSSAKDPAHSMFTPSSNNTHTTTSYNPTNTSSYNAPNTAPTSYTTPSNTTIPAYEKTTTTKTYPSSTATSSAPIIAAASAPHMSNTSADTTTHHSSATPNELKAAHTIAAGIPASYHGSVPQAGPGEEVVWVKTVTTTDYYDDGTPTGRADVVDRHQEAIDPSAYATVKDGEKVYNSNDQNTHRQEYKDQRGAGGHM